jgi:deoxyribodipyrimidine photo-lyase
MWVAAFVVHFRRIRWQAGAAWFLEHLLDGDPASNNLSWQWVASTFSSKPYYFNRDNLEQFTDGALLPSSASHYRQWVPVRRDVRRPADDASFRGSADRMCERAGGTTMSGVLVWIHGDSLDPQGPALRRSS